MRKLAAIKKEVVLQPQQERLLKKSRAVAGLVANHGLGSGKTLGSLAVAEERGGKVLVVAPASLVSNYRKELEKFVTRDRHSSYEIISYARLRRNAEQYAAMRPKTLILDEVHRARNSGKTREAVKLVRAASGMAIGLTGSLASNELTDVPRLTSLVAGTPLISDKEFKKKHVKVDRPTGLSALLGKKPGPAYIAEKDSLRRILGPHVDKFSGSEQYRKSVPSIQESVVRVPMSLRQERIYSALLRDNPALARKVKKNLPPSRSDLRRMGAFMTGLRMVSNSPATLDITLQGSDSPKAQAVVSNILQDMKENPRHRALVYSNFVEGGVGPVEDTLKQHGIQSRRFTGKEPKKLRNQAVRDFNTGEAPVLFISPAGGEGLDLKGTRGVHILEDHWNPERAAQAIGRAARYKSHTHLPAQEQNVHVRRYHAVPQGGALRRKLKLEKKTTGADEWIYKRQREKARLNRDLLSIFEEEA